METNWSSFQSILIFSIIPIGPVVSLYNQTMLYHCTLFLNNDTVMLYVLAMTLLYRTLFLINVTVMPYVLAMTPLYRTLCLNNGIMHYLYKYLLATTAVYSVFM